MARNFVEGDLVRFTRKEFTLVDMEYYDGRMVCDLEPRRLFPTSGGERYISLLDTAGKEQAIIRDLSTLLPESAEVIRSVLREYYLIPQITAVLDVTEKNGSNTWTVMTDRGKCSFQIQHRYTDVKQLYDGRILVRDTNDNRYEISDVTKLDKHSRRELNSQI